MVGLSDSCWSVIWNLVVYSILKIYLPRLRRPCFSSFFFTKAAFAFYGLLAFFFLDEESNFAFFFSVCRGEIQKSKCKFEYRIASKYLQGLLELDKGAFYMATVIPW